MKTVAVTGASRGLGLAVTRRLIADGYRVLALSRTEGDALKALGEAHAETLAFTPLDLRDIDGVQETARALVKREKRIYGLVNNAALGQASVLATMGHAEIAAIMQTNLLGPIVLTKYIMRAMLVAREGRIVNISSINAQTGFHAQSVYAATKAGIEGFTRSLSREAGKRNVTVNCVAPGFLETGMSSGFDDAQLASIRRRAPLGLPNLEEVSGAVAYLLSPDAARITGTVLTVDGGSTA